MVLAAIFGPDLFIVLVVLLCAVAVPIWAIVDAANRPATAFYGAGSNKTAWIVLIVIAWLIGLLPRWVLSPLDKTQSPSPDGTARQLRASPGGSLRVSPFAAGKVGRFAILEEEGFMVMVSNSPPGAGVGSVQRTLITLSPMPSDLALKAMNRVHRVLLGASGGRLGWHFSGMPVLELTTTGRKSGQPRTTMLTSPYQEDSTIVVVASRGGDDTNPAWFLNLRDDPKVMVKLGPQPAESMIAEIADANERARIWPIIAGKHRNYAGYQRKTDREIPLVLLRPAGG